MAEKNQKLVLAILEYLEKSIADGSVREDDKEGVEVASAFFVLYCATTKRRRRVVAANVHRRLGPGRRGP